MATVPNYTNDIEKLYVIFFNRPADTSGFLYWHDVAVNNGGNFNAIAQTFAQSQEFLDLYAGHDTAGLVNRAYISLFSHNADPSGLQYWTNAINSGQVNLGDAVMAIANGARGQDYRTLELKTWAAGAFTGEVGRQEQYWAERGYTVKYGGSVENEAARLWLMNIYDDTSHATHTIPGNITKTVRSIIDLEQTFSLSSFMQSASYDKFSPIDFADEILISNEHVADAGDQAPDNTALDILAINKQQVEVIGAQTAVDFSAF
jgi:hypothetical protein